MKKQVMKTQVMKNHSVSQRGGARRAALAASLYASLHIVAAGGLPAVAFADDKQLVRERIEAAFPYIGITRIEESAVPSLYEVLLGADIVYATTDGRYLLHGDLIDLQERANLSERRRKLARRDMIRAIAPEETVTFAAADARHDVYVFTDVSCGYCRQLHRDMAELNRLGIAVHYLAFPRAGPGSPEFADMEAIWCSDDRRQAMTIAKAGGRVTAKKCDNPVGRQYQLGQELGVNGTPALYLKDGRSLPGYLPPEVLLEELDRG